MNVISVVEIDGIAPINGQIMPGRQDGAFGCHIDVFENGSANTTFAFHGLTTTPALDEIQYAVGTPCLGTLGLGESFGGPISTQATRLFWLGIQPKRATLTFFDQPLQPHGAIKLLSHTEAGIAPAGVSNPASLDFPGAWVSQLQILHRATQTSELDADITAAPNYSGQALLSGPLPANSHFPLLFTIRTTEGIVFRANNTGAAAMDWFLTVWGALS